MWKIELTNEQVQRLLDSADVAGILVGLGGLIEPVTANLLGAGIKLNRWRIARANKGNGVIISIPPMVGGLGYFFISVKPR